MSGVNIGAGPWAYWDAFLEGAGVMHDDLGNELIDSDGNVLQWTEDPGANTT